MWILPKQLISDFAPDTEGLSLDCDEQSQLCAVSLFARSKPSPARTWLQKWKRDSWTQHLYGRILKPSLGKAFEIAWTSSLEDIPANHSAQQESEQEKMILDIFGPSSQAEFDFFGQGSASLKTSKDISLWGCPTSSKTWQEWVTERRGAYSQRVKSARLTNASASSSWPTATTRDYKGAYRPESMIRSDGKSRAMDTLDQAVVTVASWPTPTVAEAGGISNQPNYGQIGLSNHPAIVGLPTREKGIKSGHPVPASSSSHGSHQGWLTPQLQDSKHGGSNPSANRERDLLVNQVNWATPQLQDGHNIVQDSTNHKTIPAQLTQMNAAGKLNPRWVETLMGLPIGWTMPSCSSPATIELTNCDSSGTELSQQQQSELFDC